MEYPIKFQKKVLQLFPNNEEVNKMMESGDERLGNLLYEQASKGVSTEKIKKTKFLEILKQEAERAEALDALYNEWTDLLCKHLKDMVSMEGVEEVGQRLEVKRGRLRIGSNASTKDKKSSEPFGTEQSL